MRKLRIKYDTINKVVREKERELEEIKVHFIIRLILTEKIESSRRGRVKCRR